MFLSCIQGTDRLLPVTGAYLRCRQDPYSRINPIRMTSNAMMFLRRLCKKDRARGRFMPRQSRARLNTTQLRSNVGGLLRCIEGRMTCLISLILCSRPWGGDHASDGRGSRDLDSSMYNCRPRPCSVAQSEHLSSRDSWVSASEWLGYLQIMYLEEEMYSTVDPWYEATLLM